MLFEEVPDKKNEPEVEFRALTSRAASRRGASSANASIREDREAVSTPLSLQGTSAVETEIKGACDTKVKPMVEGYSGRFFFLITFF